MVLNNLIIESYLKDKGLVGKLYKDYEVRADIDSMPYLAIWNEKTLGEKPTDEILNQYSLMHIKNNKKNKLLQTYKQSKLNCLFTSSQANLDNSIIGGFDGMLELCNAWNATTIDKIPSLDIPIVAIQMIYNKLMTKRDIIRANVAIEQNNIDNIFIKKDKKIDYEASIEAVNNYTCSLHVTVEATINVDELLA